MKRFTLRFFVALLTFTVGISTATFWYFHPHFSRTPTKIEADASAWRVLLSFENQDLKKLDRESRVEVQKAIDVLLDKPKDSESEFLIPRFVSKISNSQAQIRYALVEEDPLVSIPGNSGVHVHLFNLEGKLLNSSVFSSGYRMGITDMRITYMPEIGREVIKVNTMPVFREDKQYEEKQYYALIGEKILLLRLEESSGQLIQNVYDEPHFTIGLTILGRSAKEWEQALESDDIAEVLATLTWLNGRHWNPRKPKESSTDEEANEGRVAYQMRSQEGVKASLKRLLKSENTWVRQAAELAAKVE